MSAKMMLTEDGKTVYGYTVYEVKEALNEALIESYQKDEDLDGMYDRIINKLGLKER